MSFKSAQREPAAARGHDTPNIGRVSVAGLIGLLAIHHVVALFTESINWDEFGLLQRAQTLNATGVFMPGGRPGLALLVLAPLVDHCTDAIANARTCRIVWLVFGLGYPLALFTLLRTFLAIGHPRNCSTRDALVGVALLTLVPVWTRWSLHVRTDQPALFFALLAGTALLWSRDKPRWAALAGVLLTFGYLFSQKALYVAVAVGLLVLSAELRQGLCLRTLALRLSAFVASAGATYGAFRTYIELSFAQPPHTAAGSGLKAFEHYQSILNFRLYPYLAPSVWLHWLLLAGLLATTAWAVKHRPFREERNALYALGTAWSLLAAGVATASIHAIVFAYFWFTVGLFPACALAVSLAPLRKLLQEFPRFNRWASVFFFTGTAASLAATAPSFDSVLTDTQSHQRRTLQFIESQLPANARGFHPESALYCREPKPTFPTFFSLHIKQRLQGAQNASARKQFLEEFRSTPISFLVESFRLSQFPLEIQEFWANHYMSAGPGVLIPGFRVDPSTTSVEVLVPGKYRWLPLDLQGPLTIAGRSAVAGDRVLLQAAPVSSVKASSPGLLLFDTAGLPARPQPFYSLASILELDARL